MANSVKVEKKNKKLKYQWLKLPARVLTIKYFVSMQFSNISLYMCMLQVSLWAGSGIRGWVRNQGLGQGKGFKHVYTWRWKKTRSLATTVFLVIKYTGVTKWRSPADGVAGLGGLTVQVHCLSRYFPYPPPQPQAQLSPNEGSGSLAMLQLLHELLHLRSGCTQDCRMSENKR